MTQFHKYLHYITVSSWEVVSALTLSKSPSHGWEAWDDYRVFPNDIMLVCPVLLTNLMSIFWPEIETEEIALRTIPYILQFHISGSPVGRGVWGTIQYHRHPYCFCHWPKEQVRIQVERAFASTQRGPIYHSTVALHRLAECPLHYRY